MSLSSPVTDESGLSTSNLASAALYEKETQVNDYASLHIPTRPGVNLSQEETGDNGAASTDLSPINSDQGMNKQIAQDENQVLSNMESDFLQTDTSRRSFRSASSLIACSRPSGLNFVPLGSSPCVDVFVRLGNGIRAAIVDLYIILEEMREHVTDLRTKQVSNFFDWWNVFSSFISTTLDAYSSILLPWASAYSPLKEEISEAGNVTKTISKTISCFQSIEAHISRRAPDETISKIIRGLEDMGEGVSKLLERVENGVPDKLDDAGVRDKEVRKMEKKVVRFVHRHGSNGCRKIHLLILEKGMSVPEAAAWKSMAVPWNLRLNMWACTGRFDTMYLSAIRELSSRSEKYSGS